MIIFSGKSAAPGFAKGLAYRLQERENNDFVKSAIKDVGREKERLQTAIEQSISKILRNKAKMLDRLSADELEIYDAHASILEDPELIGQSLTYIEKEQTSSEMAIFHVASQFEEQLRALEDEYLSARADDIHEVVQGVIFTLRQTEERWDIPNEDFVLIARQITTHQLSVLENEHLKGIATVLGGTTDHVAIISKALGVPLLVGLDPNIIDIQSGDSVIMDGWNEKLILEPDEKTLETYAVRERQFANQVTEAKTHKDKAAISKSGKQIKVFANVAKLNDVEIALQNGAEGIGLLRTELTFMNTDRAPTEEEHFSFYRTVLEKMGAKEVVIRMLDFGSDKSVSYLMQEQEENPAMGVRALRLGFEYYDTLLKPQIRALLRASQLRPIQVLCPMIATPQDFIQIQERFIQESRTLFQEHTEPLSNIELGIMVEIPYVAIFPELFVEKVDFFSFGTNDLAQFLMAADRSNEKVSIYLDAAKNGIISLIQSTVNVAHQHGKWVGICGELASDPELLHQFLEIGVDEISMPPPLIPFVKESIRNLQ